MILINSHPPTTYIHLSPFHPLTFIAVTIHLPHNSHSTTSNSPPFPFLNRDTSLTPNDSIIITSSNVLYLPVITSPTMSMSTTTEVNPTSLDHQIDGAVLVLVVTVDEVV